ncbi:bifunctional diaminohydroxyphosphoribosylaminopyrimidine deaminase/5-amino-6-(5-phosphoribosylamino)uracil reductase RibD [Gordonia sp. zg691]|uniref:Riboflavin biosynthesis protein RibD n=1 Tax=Gordonia jinghuaiqii TaxID=2758710 RepID=A0A7D7LWU6_9ACTN|nr:bifunctional diaminohydroxyphosphoribosylaminopyrimidine deaminase/5-amino-6-(5-phosphoribosylamino)uracil reductase RibD [Gordonia jinghuaiqii]MBD0861494.1 bifunctional diaminohydroxyphosphoribosylaminopyrimidine deaminase/5-amino-6-(5-phosphoribosylamino)uracil reductase RibD [Gordonia jinghuaiqii]MCR5976408.1 bifunctional diaminohydroxyphosphoribosylaminopyrimidine deaminase/5-amino-6-(5-phosphoribosylamino)uracil reductase RibD [Gordonia jinghuaiqii]QMT03621.1 bifunctional diaminohydroxyp
MDIAAAMDRAVEASYAAMGVSSPNPPVGAVILAADGTLAGVGATQPPGGPHAEVMALRDAGDAARGGTAVVTLEPCNHTGRTGPCSQALIEAGIADVHYAVGDPNPVAAGGADTLRAAGVRVTGGVGAADVENGPLRPWLTRQRLGRPMVTAKIAAGIDGRIAAPDGTSQWITGPAARDHAHRQRARIDAIVIGTGTALADNPTLTARAPDGLLYAHQPARVILGHRDLPVDANLRDDTGGRLVRIESHDPAAVLAALPDALWILVEGGPHILGAFFDAGLVDEVHAYVAPMVLGAGRSSVEIPGVTTLDDAHRFHTTSLMPLGDDVLITMTRPLTPTRER